MHSAGIGQTLRINWEARRLELKDYKVLPVTAKLKVRRPYRLDSILI
jgi:hypothetical protein